MIRSWDLTIILFFLLLLLFFFWGGGAGRVILLYCFWPMDWTLPEPKSLPWMQARPLYTEPMKAGAASDRSQTDGISRRNQCMSDCLIVWGVFSFWKWPTQFVCTMKPQVPIEVNNLSKLSTLTTAFDSVDGRNPANQLRLVVFPTIYKVLYIPGGWPWDFGHQQ